MRADGRPGKGHLLRFRDPQTGKDLLTYQESEEGRLKERKGRLDAEDRLKAAEDELACLRAQIARPGSGRDGVRPDSGV